MYSRERVRDALYDTFCGCYHPDSWEEYEAEFWKALGEPANVDTAQRLARLEKAATEVREELQVGAGPGWPFPYSLLVSRKLVMLAAKLEEALKGKSDVEN